MTEKEKMQKQMLYDANNDRDLLGERAKAKDLCYQFNQLRPSDDVGRILRTFKIKKNVEVTDNGKIII